MTHLTLRILREEHRALAAILRSIPMLLAENRRRGVAPDFAALRAMLFYVDEFPEQHHHRVESEALFPRLRARTTLASALLEQLDADHALGERRIRKLEHALTAFEMLGECRRVAFEASAAGYVDFYLRHMAIEEQEVLPLAQRTLTADDWQELDKAIASHRDPLTGHEVTADYRALFTRILNAVPAPPPIVLQRRHVPAVSASRIAAWRAPKRSPAGVPGLTRLASGVHNGISRCRTAQSICMTSAARPSAGSSTAQTG